MENEFEKQYLNNDNDNDPLRKYYNYEVLDNEQAEIIELRQRTIDRERKLQQKKTERKERKEAKKRIKEERRNLKKELFALKHPVLAKKLSYLSSMSCEEVMRFIILNFNIYLAILLIVLCTKILTIIVSILF